MNRAEALELALKWAEIGVPAFPVALQWSVEKQSVDKVPLTRHGFKDASTDPVGLRAMFETPIPKGSELGVAVVPGPGGFIVLDVDVKGGAPGLDELDALTEEHGYVTGMVVNTVSGGRHVWLRRPWDDHIGNTPLAPHIDIRCDAGYVIAAGTTSKWGDWRKAVGSLTEAEVMPPTWAKLLNVRREDGTREPIAEKLTAGMRHAALARMAGAMRRQGATEEEMLVALRAMNQTRCDPPKPDDELVKLARDFALYEAEPDEEPMPVRLKGRMLGEEASPALQEDVDLSYIDLTALMNGERPEEVWLIKPILPKGKLVGFTSTRGHGKSFLLLDTAAAVATGRAFLHQEEQPPQNVLYLDMEMNTDDLYERLEDLGYVAGTDELKLLSQHLFYFQTFLLPPLNTKEGGELVEKLVKELGATMVVIDTLSGAVAGTENEAEPYVDLFKHTERRLKAMGVTLARLDHLGKDTTRGSVGSSAKERALDIVWRITPNLITGALELKAEKRRSGLIPDEVLILRTDFGSGRSSGHTMPPAIEPDWLPEVVAHLDRLQVPPTLSLNKALALFQQAGLKARSDRVREAQKYRRTRIGG